MNFLAHLWLTDRASLPLAGAILGDVVRGPLPAAMPEPLAQSVQLHRRVDAHTDRHPRMVEARATFPAGARRYAGIVLDVVLDHALAMDWPRYSTEALAQFCSRAAREVAAERTWFESSGAPAPEAQPFSRLLQSYGTEAGIEHAVARIARRLRRPEGLLAAATGWPALVPQAREDLPLLFEHLR